jgi:5-methylcytosine-specific restriction endonuclease McrA
LPRAPKHCGRAGCLTPVIGKPYCPEHTAEAQRRPNTTARGLGAEHQARRAEMLPHAYGQPCAYCGGLMLPGQALHADHSKPRALNPGSVADRITHARCNESAGGRMNAKTPPGGTPSAPRPS